MDSRQPQIARGDAIVPISLEMPKKSLNAWRIQIGQIKHLDSPLAFLRSESQQHHDRIAVAVDRVLAHATLRWQIFFEETHDRSAELCDLVAAHDRPPSTTWPNRWAKRSLASAASSSVHWR